MFYCSPKFASSKNVTPAQKQARSALPHRKNNSNNNNTATAMTAIAF
jgi:hypothetical protein